MTSLQNTFQLKNNENTFSRIFAVTSLQMTSLQNTFQLKNNENTFSRIFAVSPERLLFTTAIRTF